MRDCTKARATTQSRTSEANGALCSNRIGMEIPLKFVIVGAGALGTVMAGHLARAGQDVTLVARGKRAAFLKKTTSP